MEADPSLARGDSDLGGPLFVAARSGRVEVAKLLLEHGADPNKVNDKGNTPLWFAAQSPARPASDRIAVMKLLLDAGADIHKRCENGTTALHFAAWRGPVEVAEYLLSRGARAWMTDDKDRTPKDHAVQMSNAPDKEDIIRLFSEHPEPANLLAGQEKPSLPSALTVLEELALELTPELESHQLFTRTGVWLESAALKVLKPNWTDGAGHETFFSVWLDAKDLKKGRFNYNIHALKMRLLPGYAMSAGDFASGFRRRLAAVGGDWPNLKTDYGPQTLMQGWRPFDPQTFREEVAHLVREFVKIHKIIDDLMEEARIS